MDIEKCDSLKMLVQLLICYNIVNNTKENVLLNMEGDVTFRIINTPCHTGSLWCKELSGTET